MNQDAQEKKEKEKGSQQSLRWIGRERFLPATRSKGEEEEEEEEEDELLV